MRVRIRLDYSELADTYFWLRGRADREAAEGGPVDQLRRRIAAVYAGLPRRADILLDPMVASQPPDEVLAALIGLGPAELGELAAHLPGLDGNRLAQSVSELAHCLAAAPAPPADRRSSAEAAFASLDDAALGRAAASVADALGLAFPADAEITIPVRLVADGIPLGGVTGPTLAGQPACFAAVRGHEGSTLAELVVHEATHALDILSSAEDSLVQRLRGEPGADPQLWHATFFLAAAAAVRRHITADHQDFGVTHGYYQRVPTVVRDLIARGIASQLGADAFRPQED